MLYRIIPYSFNQENLLYKFIKTLKRKYNYKYRFNSGLAKYILAE